MLVSLLCVGCIFGLLAAVIGRCLLRPYWLRHKVSLIKIFRTGKILVSSVVSLVETSLHNAVQRSNTILCEGACGHTCVFSLHWKC